MDSSQGQRLPEEVYEALVDLLAEAEDGQSVDLEGFLREHAEHAGAIREVRDRWARTDHFLARLGLDGSGGLTDGLEARTAATLARLAEPRPRGERYRPLEEIGRGGMAKVFRCWDEDLRREVAMKVVRGHESASVVTSRFLEEAQITGRLDHPGVVAVHELGVDGRGGPFFTMTLVEGEDLSTLFERARGGGEWNLTRVVGVLLKVCEALAYAHSRGVVHRDLKPANIRVGRFGQVYVMDWGLARAASQGQEPGSNGSPEDSPGDEASTSPVLTGPGEVVGTAAYMAPEQASGDARRVGPPADVYALGAMLYELFTGDAPYLDEKSGSTRREVLARLIDGPPAPLDRVGSHAPPELAAICDKAMQRDPDRRYPTMEALAEELRAYLEGRVVRAYRTGAWEEFKRWVARNRGTALAVAAGGLLAVAGLLATWWVREHGRVRVQQIAELQVLLDLERDADELWPPYPDQVGPLREWLVRADGLRGRVGSHRRALAELRDSALAYTPEDRAADRASHPRAAELSGLRSQLEVLDAGLAQLAEEADVPGDHGGTAAERRRRLEEQIAFLEEVVSERRTFRMPTRDQQARHDILTRLVERHDRFVDLDPMIGAVASVKRRLEVAEELAEVAAGTERDEWLRARREIQRHPEYGGLVLEPQVGLLPLGPDPRSGLWEFAHLLTGAPVTRAGESLAFDAESGVVLVLVPGGTYTLGARLPLDPERPGPHEDPAVRARGEGPVRTVELDPFFLSKYELTQAQWLRLTGANPSFRYPRFRNLDIGWTHPVEQVSWAQAEAALLRCGLQLPTEAQWETAARAGTTTPYWTGRDPLALRGVENLDDRLLLRDARHELVLDLPHEDGHSNHAPVTSFAPNPWGFHHMLGNVTEICRDVFMVDLRWPLRAGDGLRVAPEDHGLRAVRGGNFYVSEAPCRVTWRSDERFDLPRGGTTGVRPARRLEL